MSLHQPLPIPRIIDEYFLESRNRLLELAAFFDRLDRASDGSASSADFRVAALRSALTVLSEDQPGRVEKILLLLSDPTDAPLAELDRKGALGAYRSKGDR